MGEDLAGAVARALGRRVVLLREQRGLTQVALAKALSWPQPMISRLENGRQPVLLRQLVRLAVVLDVDLSVLVCGRVPAELDQALRPDLEALVREAAPLTPAHVAVVTQLLRQLRPLLAGRPEIVEQEEEEI